MTPSNTDIRSTVKRNPSELFRRAAFLRDEEASGWVRRVYSRPAKVYAPFISPNSLSRAKNGSGGPFGQLAMWLAGLDASELALARSYVDTVFDEYEIATIAAVCPDEAMHAQQVSDMAEDVAESDALRRNTPEWWERWMERGHKAEADLRVAIRAICVGSRRRRHEHGNREAYGLAGLRRFGRGPRRVLRGGRQ